MTHYHVITDKNLLQKKKSKKKAEKEKEKA